MESKEKELLNKLRELVDEFEEHFGNLEGFEVLLEKEKDEAGTVQYSNLKEVNLYYFTKTNIIK
jgi:hypothetical protein